MNEQSILERYNDIVQYNNNYCVMLDTITSLVCGDVLEVGVGTGLLTRKLLHRDLDDLVAVESNQEFIAKFRNNLPQQRVIHADAVTYQHPEKVDTIVMSLVYHHIEDGRKKAFLKNMYNSLREGGKIVIGDVFLLPYEDEQGRDESLRIFHNHRIAKIDDPFIREVEEETLREGLARSGEYKTSEEVLRSLLVKVGFKKIEAVEIGDQETGGYRVVIARKSE